MTLDREKVTRAALGLLNQVGLDGLTVRKLGAALGVQAAALYWHFKNKREMLDEMATLALTDATREFGPPLQDEPWDEWSLRYGRSLRQTFLRYRDGAKMICGTHMTGPALYEAMDASLRVFQGQGFPLPEAAQALNTLYCYVVGFTIEEQVVYPYDGLRSEQYVLEQRAVRIDADISPSARAASHLTLADFNERFERGLRIVISGIRQQSALQANPLS
jgi:TetR/AcrR family tetracycline transcriptional repressor